MEQLSVYEILAFSFSAAAYVPYVYLILRSNKRPTVSAWICWGFMDAVIGYGMYQAGKPAWQMFAYTVGCVAVIVSCLIRRASLGWSRMDSVCTVIVLVALYGWTSTGNPEIAVYLSTAAAVIGSVPLIVNAYREPEREPLTPWIICAIGGYFGVRAINDWSFIAATSVTVFFALQCMFTVLIARQYTERVAAMFRRT